MASIHLWYYLYMTMLVMFCFYYAPFSFPESGIGQEESGAATLPPVQDYILQADYMLAHEYPTLETLNEEPAWKRYIYIYSLVYI